MLEHGDLRRIRAWCRQRQMRCYPAEAGPSIVLERGQPPRRMMLERRADEFLLRDERCLTLAVASDLPALLDAVDAGLADAA